MDLRNLTTFIQVAESGSFTKAGEKLGYAQPTVSLQIKQLEAELGAVLFDRIGHTVTLTEEGREALAYAQRICHLSQEMVQEVGGAHEPAGEVRLAMADSLCSPLVMEKFAQFHAYYPKVRVQVIAAGTDEMFRMLDHNEVDIVCTLDSHIYHANYTIFGEEKVGVHLIFPANNDWTEKIRSLMELAGKTCTENNCGIIYNQQKGSTQKEEKGMNTDSIPMKVLPKLPFLLTEKGMSYRRLLEEQLAQNSLEILPVLEIGRTDLICQLVEQGVGVAFLPDYVTEEAVRAGRVVRLEVEDLQVELWKQLLYRKDKWVSGQMEACLGYLREIW